MKHVKAHLFKKLIAMFSLALFMSQISPPMWEGAARAWAETNARAPFKNDVALLEADDLHGGTRKSNVLFMVDATIPMSFTPTSVMPVVTLSKQWTLSGGESVDYDKTLENYGLRWYDIINMMKGSTFGMGALPTATGGISPFERNLYGRERDSKNNYVKIGATEAEQMEFNSKNYYYPFQNPERAKILKSAYSKEGNPLQVGFKDYKNADRTLGTQTTFNKNELGVTVNAYTYKWNTKISNAKSLPYALVFKNPNYWEKGYPGTIIPEDELVPNDSRMYQTKLVLWKLLEDEELWNSIRLGLATTFLSPVNRDRKTGGSTAGNGAAAHDHLTNRFDIHGVFKVFPFGANVYTKTKFNGAQQPYQYGVLTQAVSGHRRVYTALHSQFVPMWGSQTVETLWSGIKNGDSSIRDSSYIVWSLLNRGSLWLPIRDYDAKWNNRHKPVMSHADRFRQWIDGFGDISYIDRSLQYHYYKDPEIGIAGIGILPMAIYPDPRPINGLTRHTYLNTGNSNSGRSIRRIWYYNKDMNVDYSLNVFPGSSEFENDEMNTMGRFNAGSGEIAGSVLDFFSPTNPGSTAKPDLADISYPIRNTCDDNWVILITSGQEIDPRNSAERRYTTADAIKGLYDATNKLTSRDRRGGSDNSMRGNVIYAPYERVTARTEDSLGNRGPAKRIDLDRPIRTIVIGIVADPDKLDKKDPSYKLMRENVINMRNNLNRMARAGRGINPDDASSGVTAYFADDTETLLEQIKVALSEIKESQIQQPGHGTMEVKLGDAGDESSPGIFSSTYRIIQGNQWDATLTRYAAYFDKDGNIKQTKKWDLKDKLLEKRGSGTTPKTARNVVYWRNTSGSGEFVKLTEGDAKFKELTGMTGSRVNASNLPDGTFGGVTMDKAFYHWFQGYDYSYQSSGKGKKFPRASMLTDLGRMGIVFADFPSDRNDPLPGYNAWAKSIPDSARSNDARLYAQTNDGILHVINPNNGDEEMAILPPPVLVPWKLATLKTTVAEDKLRWINVTMPELNGLERRSNPAYLLDGPLITGRFDINRDGSPGSWRTYLIGTLGRGGNGLYAMDVTTPKSPKFAWYRENLSEAGKLLSMSAADDACGEFKWSAAASADETPYVKLGYNSPAPRMGTTGGASAAEQISFVALSGGVRYTYDAAQNGGEGAALLFIDTKSGSVIKAFDSGSISAANNFSGNSTAGATPRMGMMTSAPAFYRSDINKYLVGRVFAADNRGNVFMVRLEKPDANDNGIVKPLPVKDWSIEPIASLQTNAPNADNYSMPHGMAVAREAAASAIWLAGGTSDVLTRKTPTLPLGLIQNKSQMIFAFSYKDGQNAFYRNDTGALKQLAASSANKNDPKLTLKASEGYRGWYIPLAEDKQNNFREYVSASPYIIGNNLYISTFIQEKVIVKDMNLCILQRKVSGSSRLYMVDLLTGEGKWGGGNGKHLTIEGAKIIGMTHIKQDKNEKLLVTLDVLSNNNNIGDLVSKGYIMPGGDQNTVVIDIKPSSGTIQLKNGGSVINYWLEK
jgi:Tfp pilus tip-associated adhesin PilY1